MCKALLALLLLLALALVPAADASVLRFDTGQRTVSYEAAAGEVNRVTAVQEGALVRIVDTGATITVQAGACRAVSANEATCPVTDPRNVVRVDGGDQDDQLAFAGTVAAQLAGADGNDTLTGGDGADRLDGGNGDDELRAQDGSADEILCGAGADKATFDAADVLAADCELGPGASSPTVLDPAAPGAGLTDPAGHGGDPAQEGGIAAADPAALAALPAPRPGRSVSAARGTGTVLVRRAGSKTFEPLDPARPVPVGSIVDATRGTVTVLAAKDLSGATQSATFTGGRFAVTQKRAARMTTVLSLRGAIDCGSNRGSMTARAAGKRRRSRSLWGDGHGRFTTRGRNSTASVRGTIWGVTDRCDGTLTQVRRGAVAVKDLRSGKTRLIRAGGRFLAPNRTPFAR